MFVKNFMTRSLIAVRADEGAGPALQHMREEGLRRMPVLDSEGKLVGIITDRRLLQALAVPVRRGQQRRAPAFRPPLTVGEIMNEEIMTVAAGVPVEEAARLMAENRVGSLIVTENGQPVGIITETDMFRVFLRMLIGEEHGLRVTVRAPAFRGILADITTEIARSGGNLLSLGTLTTEDGFLIGFKVVDVNRQDLEDILEELPVDEVHIQEM